MVDKGLVHPDCGIFFAYLAVMLIGLFIGNLFFMVTMMIVLRSVFDEEKVIALSLASFITNLFGFIPAPVIYGFFIDLCCILWNRQCPNGKFSIEIYILLDQFQNEAIVCSTTTTCSQKCSTE